jgi:hypothetical protein
MPAIAVDLAQPGALMLDSVREQLASATEDTHAQRRVTKHGIAFSTTAVDHTNIDDLALRLDTWSARSDHVGPNARRP